MNMNIRNSNLAVAGNQGFEAPRGDFGGCVHYVEVWDYDLSSTEVASLTKGPSPGPSPHEMLKMKVKAAFDVVKSPEKKNALPGLIRKAFHDAGHFDKTEPEARMGCIQHFLAGENFCPQHGHLEEATLQLILVSGKDACARFFLLLRLQVILQTIKASWTVWRMCLKVKFVAR